METKIKRLAPEARKAELLQCAKNLLSRVGVSDFSLEAVAREANVAATLPRHYFNSHAGLLMAATVDVLRDVQAALFDHDDHVDLHTRLEGCLTVLAVSPWAFGAYMRAADIHPDLLDAVNTARRRMAEYSFSTPWSEMSEAEQMYALGWIGLVESVIREWIDRGCQQSAGTLGVLMRCGLSLGVHTVRGRSASTVSFKGEMRNPSRSSSDQSSR